MKGWRVLLHNGVLTPLVRHVSGLNSLFGLVILSIFVVWADAAYADGGDYCDYPDEWYMHLECWFWSRKSGLVGAAAWFGSAAWGLFSGTFSGLFSSKSGARRYRRPPPAGGGWPATIKVLLGLTGNDGSEYRRKTRRTRAAEPIWRIVIGLVTGALTYTGMSLMAAAGAASVAPWILATSLVAGVAGVIAPDVLGILIRWINGPD